MEFCIKKAMVLYRDELTAHGLDAVHPRFILAAFLNTNVYTYDQTRNTLKITTDSDVDMRRVHLVRFKLGEMDMEIYTIDKRVADVNVDNVMVKKPVAIFYITVKETRISDLDLTRALEVGLTLFDDKAEAKALVARVRAQAFIHLNSMQEEELPDPWMHKGKLFHSKPTHTNPMGLKRG